MMTFCYNAETSMKTARTAAVFRHTLAWILHVCLISLERFLPLNYFSRVGGGSIEFH